MLLKQKHCLRVFEFIRVELRTLLKITFTHAQSAILQSRDFDLRVERALQNSLSTKLISQKVIR